MSGAVRLSVVIPHYQDLDNLGACLALLAAQTLPRDRYEIIVCDNASPAGEQALRRVVDGRARLIICPEKGAGPTRNAGAAAARPETILAFIDSDCRPRADWLEAGLAACGAHAVVGGRIDVLVPDPDRLTPVEAFELVFAFNNERYVREKGFSASANLFVRRDVWDIVGGFRNGISEDVDWCWRAREAGFPVAFAGDVGVGHPARRDWRELKAKFARIARETVLLDRQQSWPVPRLLLRPLATLLLILPQSLAVLRSDRLKTRKDKFSAIGILCAIRAFRFMEMLRNTVGTRGEVSTLPRLSDAK